MRVLVAIALCSVLPACSGCGDNGGDDNPSQDSGGDTGPTMFSVGPETPVDDAVDGNTGQNTQQPAIAFNGSVYLMVWSDSRVSRDDIFAARVGTDGTIMDASGISVNTDAGRQTQPAVAWAGDRWLIVWNSAGDIYGATLNNTTGVVTPLGAIAATAATETQPAVAASGTNALVAWHSSNDIKAVTVTAGTVGTVFDVTTAAATENDPTVAASGGTAFLVAWTTGGNDIEGRRVAAGAVSGATFTISPAGEQAEPAATFNGTDYIVAYDNGSDVYGTRVSTAGNVLDANGVAIGVAAGVQSAPSIGCDSASCFVAFMDSRAFATTGFDAYGQRVGFDLSAQGGNVLLSGIDRYQTLPAVAAATNGWLTAWEDARTGGANLLIGSRVAANGTVTDTGGIIFNKSKNAELEPAIATASSTNQLVLWSDSRIVGNDIHGVRFTGPGGDKIDAQSKKVSDAVSEQATPAVVYDGTQYLAVWSDTRNATRDIFAARFKTDGSLVDTNGFAITTAAGDQFIPDAANGTMGTLVVWQDRRNGEFDIYGAIVQNGTAMTDFAISSASGDQLSPAVAFDAKNNQFVVVWSDNRTPTSHIYAARVSPTGSVLDAAGVAVTNEANGQFRPDVAVSNGVAMVLWDDRRTDPLGDIYGARLGLGTSVTVMDATGIAISTAADQQTFPTAIGMPEGAFLAAWADNRNLLATGTDIYGAQLLTSGQVKGEAFTISNEAGNESAPSFPEATSAGVTTSVVYHAYRPMVGSSRVFRRAIVAP